MPPGCRHRPPVCAILGQRSDGRSGIAFSDTCTMRETLRGEVGRLHRRCMMNAQLSGKGPGDHSQFRSGDILASATASPRVHASSAST